MPEIIHTLKTREMRYEAARRGIAVWTDAHPCQAASRIAFDRRGISKAVRVRNRHLFRGQTCGFPRHADIQAALVFGLRGIVSRPHSDRDRLPSWSPEARCVVRLNPGRGRGHAACFSWRFMIADCLRGAYRPPAVIQQFSRGRHREPNRRAAGLPAPARRRAP